ncbi:MAG: efflux RND transporter periplasmic adaptor subunit [Armatimonadetes bacterium]|nr:efflux RND transporter periplasmic adaptor subunit [Armatimonadota bacterium]
MRKAIIFLVVALVVVLVGAGLFLQMRGFAAAGGQANAKKEFAAVDRGELSFKVVETGTLDAVRSVDVRTRASGRLKELKVEEGQTVRAGDAIALIDPLETQLRVAQDQAQLSGAEAGVQRTDIEIQQRRVTAQAALDQALARERQIVKELEAQPTLTRTGIEQAQAALNSALQDQQRLGTSTHPTQITAADTELSNAGIDQENAQREYERVADLLKRGFVSQQVVDSARLRLDQARNRLAKARSDRQRLDGQQRLDIQSASENVKSARAALERAQANAIQDDTKRQELISARASIRQARAALRDVDVLIQGRKQGKASVSQLQNVLSDSMRQLRETDVRAPMDGVVSKKYVEVGDMVTGLSAFSQGTPVVRVEDRSQLRVLLDINEIDVARLTLGMKVKVDIDAFPDKSYEGKIYQIAPASNNLQASTSTAAAAAADAVVKYRVEVRLVEADKRLRSGMSAKCTFETLHKDNVLRLPVEFVGKDAQGDFVLMAPPKDSQKAPKRVKVTLGAKTGAFVEIEAGLKEGDRVVLPDYKGPARKGFFSGPGDDEQDQGNADKSKGGAEKSQ